MRTTMDFFVSVKCPHDGESIGLSVSVDAGNETLLVEDLLETVNEMKREPIIQESFTRLLAHRLDLPVKTVGIHSGVTITCEAGAP